MQLSAGTLDTYIRKAHTDNVQEEDEEYKGYVIEPMFVVLSPDGMEIGQFKQLQHARGFIDGRIDPIGTLMKSIIAPLLFVNTPLGVLQLRRHDYDRRGDGYHTIYRGEIMKGVLNIDVEIRAVFRPRNQFRIVVGMDEDDVLEQVRFADVEVLLNNSKVYDDVQNYFGNVKEDFNKDMRTILSKVLKEF